MKTVVRQILYPMLAPLSLFLAFFFASQEANAATRGEIQSELISVLYGGNGGYISCDFDDYSSTPGKHEGIDIAFQNGKAVYSLCDGVITRIRYGKEGRGTPYSSYLSTVAIYYELLDKTVVYLHMAPLSSLYVGEHIVQGQQLGTHSWRGVSTASDAHTHVEVRDGWQTAAAKSVEDPVLENSDPYPFWETVLCKEPSYVKFWTYNTRFTANQNITLNYTSDTATSFFLHVFKKGGNEIESIQVSPAGTDTYRIASPGDYTLYIGGANNSGSIASNSIDITILEARKPARATLTTTTPVCEAGMYARFKYSSDTATHFYLHIFDTDLNEVACVEAPVSGIGAYLLDIPGKYTFYIGVANDYGDLASNSVTVDCRPSVVPQTASFQADETVINGSPISLQYTSDTATEFYLHVFDSSKHEIECVAVSSSGHDEYTIEDAGLYTLYIGAANSKGAVASNSVDVAVMSTEGDVLRLPTDIREIEEMAFSGCSARRVILPNGVESIGDYAFSDCDELELIEIPETVTIISEHAFEGSENVVIAGRVASAAYEYAQTYNIPFARRYD